MRTSAIAAARFALILGVSVSFVFLIGGLVLQSVAGGEDAGPPGLLNPEKLLNIGIIILLGTPVLRVLVLALGFLREKEVSFAALGFCILLLLGVSVAIGLLGA